MNELSHFDEQGASRMVDVGDKPATARVARATGWVHMRQETWQRIRAGGFKKGDVLEVARIAGIMAAKRTADLVPLCHNIPLSGAKIDFTLHHLVPSPDMLGERDTAEGCELWSVRIEASVRTNGQTGVEMEALTAVTVAALTIYDMCKAVDREMTIDRIQLEEKSGGTGGSFRRSEASEPGNVAKDATTPEAAPEESG